MTFEQVHAKLALLREQLEKLDRIPRQPTRSSTQTSATSTVPCAAVATSSSLPGEMPSRYSTTLTFAPSRFHTDPSSSPI